MIVEDDPLIRQLFKQLLTEKGYEIVGEAADGQQAITIFKSLSEKPDMILLDFRIPKKNGLEVMKEILENDPSIEILMISGDPNVNRKAIINGGARFKQKPVRIEELLNEIEMINQKDVVDAPLC